MKLSIVTTLYCSAPYVEEFHRRVTAVAREVAGNDYEIVMVNDGSPDESLDLAVRLSAHDPHIVVVDLSRNFGHHKAMMTGLAHAAGDLIFLIDSDLEEEPEWLSDFASKMEQEGCDVVYGVQKHRKGGIFERWSGELFYCLLRWITGIHFPKNIVTARLMSNRYVKCLVQHKERECFILGLFYITGYDQKPLVVYKRNISPTTYTFSRKLSLSLNAITSFSAMPLIFIFYIGFSISFISFLFIIYMIYGKFFLYNTYTGWTSIIVTIFFLGGIIMLSIGVIGIYLYKIFYEIKDRPYTIIKKIYRNN